MTFVKKQDLHLRATIKKEDAISLIEKASNHKINMNYFNKYWEVVQRNIRSPHKDFENHHIVPQAYRNNLLSCFDINTPENITSLSYKDHFYAHWYLWKAVRDTNTALSAKLMYGLKRKMCSSEKLDLSAEEYSILKSECWNKETKKRHSNKLKDYYSKNPDSLTRIGCQTKEYFSSQENREAQSNRIKNIHKERPELGEEHSKRMKNRLKNNPNIMKEHREKLKEHYKDKLNRERISKSLKEFNKANPEFRKQNSENIKEKWRDPEYRLTLSLAKMKPITCKNTGISFVSAIVAEKELGGYRGTFRAQAIGRRITAWNGYYFKYANKDIAKKIKNEYFEFCMKEIRMEDK